MPLPEQLLMCDTPDRAWEYWTLHVATSPFLNGEVETFVVLHLNTRRRVIFHTIIATGSGHAAGPCSRGLQNSLRKQPQTEKYHASQNREWNLIITLSMGRRCISA